MSHTDIDPQIDSDLSALAGESQRGLGDFSEVAAILDGGRPAYRDERPGTEARRDALSRRRHLELALLPLSLERVFVHRVSRAAAGAVAALCAAAVMVGLGEPNLIRLADLMIPGRVTFTLASALIAALVLATYVAAGWVAERLFEQRMRESLETTGDPHADLETLARGPIDRARALVRRADGWAIGLPLAAVATLAPLFVYLFLATALLGMRSVVYSLADVVMVGAISGDLVLLALGMAAGIAVATVAARACDREHRSLEPPRVLRWLEHVAVLPAAAVAGLSVMAALGSAASLIRTGGQVFATPRLLLAIGGTLAVIAPAAWALLRYRRVEERRLRAGSRPTD